MNTEMALKDFLQRIEHYQEKYMALDEKRESDLSFMKIYNTGVCALYFLNLASTAHVLLWVDFVMRGRLYVHVDWSHDILA
jgi:hypothetical protein